MPSKVTIDIDECIGCQTCVELCPEVFDFDLETEKDTYAPEEKQEKGALERRVKELEKALEQAKFKNIAIETMIDIAEEQLKISIRKKSGPKQ